MDFYTEMRNIASDLITEFKQGSVAYVEYTAPAGATPDDPGEPVASVTPIDGVARGVSMQYVDNTLVTASDLQVTFAAGVVTPKLSGFMRIDDVDHKVLRVMPKPAAGTPVAWTVVVAR